MCGRPTSRPPRPELRRVGATPSWLAPTRPHLAAQPAQLLALVGGQALGLALIDIEPARPVAQRLRRASELLRVLRDRAAARPEQPDRLLAELQRIRRGSMASTDILSGWPVGTAIRCPRNRGTPAANLGECRRIRAIIALGQGTLGIRISELLTRTSSGCMPALWAHLNHSRYQPGGPSTAASGPGKAGLLGWRRAFSWSWPWRLFQRTKWRSPRCRARG
jgi:hypothetical protein